MGNSNKTAPKGYEAVADMDTPLRFYELFRGLTNLFASFIDAIVKLFS